MMAFQYTEYTVQCFADVEIMISHRFMSNYATKFEMPGDVHMRQTTEKSQNMSLLFKSKYNSIPQLIPKTSEAFVDGKILSRWHLRLHYYLGLSVYFAVWCVFVPNQ